MGNAIGMGDLAAELLALPFRAVARMSRLPGISLACSPFAVVAAPDQQARSGRRGDGQCVGNAAANEAGGRAAMYRGIVAWLVGGLAQEVADPRDATRSMLETVRRGPDLIRLMVPGRASRAAWTEFRNKIAAYRWFATADAVLGLPVHGKPDLPTLLRCVSALDLYQGLWTTEGLGYYCAAAALRQVPWPSSLLAVRMGNQLPSGSLIPLHTGMGLAFAGSCLEGCTTDSCGVQIRRQLDRFVKLCQENAQKDFAGASMEALGLMTRLLRPRLVPVLDEQLVQMDGDLTQRFWHGVGRALYFGPTNVLPCGGVVWPNLLKACREAPYEENRRNVLAGLGLALTLVNLCHPEVIARYLEHFAGPLSENDAFAHGVRSALLIWSRWAPASAHADTLFRHRPDHVMARLWDGLVREPALEALRPGREQVEAENWAGAIFRYQPRVGRKCSQGSR
jgi:hypothetical protein